MGKFVLKTDALIREFVQKHIPNELVWNQCAEGETLMKMNSLSRVGLTQSSPLSLIIQAGLRIPFDPLLVEFFKNTRLHLSQITLNTLRIVLGVAKLNLL